MTCKYIRGDSHRRRHEAIVAVLDACDELGVDFTHEPRTLGKKRIRADALFRGTVHDLATDVSVTFPGRAAIRGESRMPAAKSIAQKKTNMYAPRYLPDGVTFKPFVMESTGAMHEDTRTVLEVFSRTATQSVDPWEVQPMRQRILSRVCVALHRGNQDRFMCVRWQRPDPATAAYTRLPVHAHRDRTGRKPTDLVVRVPQEGGEGASDSECGSEGEAWRTSRPTAPVGADRRV